MIPSTARPPRIRSHGVDPRGGAFWPISRSPNSCRELGASWPQPRGHGCYRVQITGEPNYTMELQLMGTDGDHNTAGLKATAMRLVNAIPAVIAAEPGIVTALDLPPITGRGLVVT